LKRHLPNAITCLNLFAGCLALVQIFAGNPQAAAYLVGIAALFDFVDGLIARALHVSSPIGKDLDSLADMVSFGVVPGAFLFTLLQQARPAAGLPQWLAYAGFIVTVFSALRLAKFNNDTRQTTSFIGLPTPANTLLVASLPLILANDTFGLTPYILNAWVLLPHTLLVSYLLVAEIPLFALKFKNMSWQDNSLRFIFVLLAVVLILLLQATAIPLVVLLYVALSMLKPSYS
jgi:CDP-diacylglycerol--serine O-phosphatidyltransferase